MYDFEQQVILAVDDEPDNLFVLKATLELMNNATVETVSSFEEAIERAKAIAPQIIITDISMPQSDGLVVLRRFRTQPGGANLTIIALTAHAMRGDRANILAAGFDGYIAKPFDINTMAEEIGQIVEQHNLRISC